MGRKKEVKYYKSFCPIDLNTTRSEQNRLIKKSVNKEYDTRFRSANKAFKYSLMMTVREWSKIDTEVVMDPPTDKIFIMNTTFS